MITNEDLLKEISSQQLLELSDINATGELNQSVIDDSIQDAISFTESFIVLPSNPTPLLKKILIGLTIFDLRRKNEYLSDEDKALKKEYEGYLLKMNTGRLKTEITEISEGAYDEDLKSYAFRHKRRTSVTKGFR